MLMVVFGAGASYDSSPVYRASSGSTPFRPPLTNELFSFRSDFHEALDAYPQLQTIISSLRTLPERVSLEQRLAVLQAERNDVPYRYQELMAIRFYLQQILWATPTQWSHHAHGASNYSTVIGQLRDWQARTKEEIALVTFNYDTLIERAYNAAFGFDPSSFNTSSAAESLPGYMRLEHFALFKPHGSVNWGRWIENSIGQVPPDASGPGYIIKNAQRVKTRDEFEILNNLGETASRRDQNFSLIPALAVPMEEKSIFECPPYHEVQLKERIPHITRLLTIGWRAAERSFLELWAGKLSPELRIHVVSPGDPAAIARTLAEGGIRGYMTTMSPMGFTEFAEGGHIDELLRDAPGPPLRPPGFASR